MVNPSLLCPTYLKVASSVSGRTYSLDTWFVGKEYKFCAKGCGGDPVSPPGQFDRASPFPGVIRECTPFYPRTAPGGNPRHGQMLSRSVDVGDRHPPGLGADLDAGRADAGGLFAPPGPGYVVCLQQPGAGITARYPGRADGIRTLILLIRDPE